MRHFWLENEIGQRISLQDKTFFHLPSGLGIGITREYGQSSDGFFVATKSETEQANIAGEFIFLEGYAGYDTVMKWIFSRYKILLVYRPLDTEYLRDIEFESVDKGELNAYGWLVSPISIRCLTPWYKRIPLSLELVPIDEEDSYKFYPAEYPMIYPLSGDTNSLDICPMGNIDAALTLMIPGILSSPTITLRRKSDQVILGRVNLDGVGIDEGEYLWFSSRHGSVGIFKVTPNDAVDLIDYVDLEDNNFFRIPVGVTCTLTIASSVAINHSTQAQVFEYYKVV